MNGRKGIKAMEWAQTVTAEALPSEMFYVLGRAEIPDRAPAMEILVARANAGDARLDHILILFLSSPEVLSCFGRDGDEKRGMLKLLALLEKGA